MLTTSSYKQQQIPALMTESANKAALECLLTRQQIQQRVSELGMEISRDFAGQTVVLVGVLKGAALFVADLARAITVDCTFDFLAVSSYGMATCSSAVRLIKDVDQPIEGKNVVLVEDILDTGRTLSYLKTVLMAQRPATLKIAALLDKPERRLCQIQADYVGFTIPNRFVVGYGMDFAEHYRNLPDICLMPMDAPTDVWE
nr:hypoxanthine phosphoribosyltransferase [uncultured Acidobacteriota bacterium]